MILPEPDAMLLLPGGEFTMGSDHHYPEEAPARRAHVEPFWIDATPVTNRQFAAFVQATGYRSVAEVAPDPQDYPGMPPSMAVAGSLVFVAPPHPVPLHNPGLWWKYVPGADWAHPEGPASGIDARMDHPVVHVAYADCAAYARWAGKLLPTEAQWEYAARGGLAGAEFAWGDEFLPDGRHAANTWQGEFPWQDLALDGHAGTSPVGSYAANGFGLFDCIGNVWEWTCDRYANGAEAAAAAAPASAASCCGTAHGQATAGTVAAPRGAPPQQHVIKGGSHLCAPNYCRRYRPAARLAQSVDTSASHLGFRCVRPARAVPGAAAARA